ncbi:MAG: hypothetical protein ACKVVP_25315, partial [Chloroflexota bacterium]
NAADVRRHQIQLNETRNRLATTEENLTRCRDVLAELEPQVRRMRSHADRAARARELRQELHRTSQLLYRHQYQAARERRVIAESRELETNTTLQREEHELQGYEARWKALEAESESLGQDLTRADQLVRELRRQRDELQRQILQAREEELQLESETRALSERHQRQERERTDVVGRVAMLKQRQVEAEAEMDRAAAELAVVAGEDRRIAQTARSNRDALVSASTQLTQMRAQLDRERQSRDVSADKAATLRVATAGVAEEIDQYESAVTSSQSAVQSATELVAAEQLMLEQAENELADTDKSISNMEAELQGLRDAARSREREQARLEAAHASLDESLKRLVLDAAGATLKRAEQGVVGVLGPALRIHGGYERLVSVALADRVGHVVMDSPAAAHELSVRVNDADERASLVLADFNDVAVQASIDQLRTVVSRFIDREGGLAGLAIDVVECDGNLQSVVRRYLGLTVMLESVTQALPLAEQLSRSELAALPWQIATHDGHVLRWNGEWRAGSDQRQVRLLVGRAELADLGRQIEERRQGTETERVRLAELERELQLRQERRGRLRAQAQSARAGLNRASAEVDKQRRQLVQAQQGRSAIDARHAATTAQLRTLEEAITMAATRITDLTARMAELGLERSRAQSMVQVDEGRSLALRERLAMVQRASAEATAQLQAVVQELRRDERLEVEISERTEALATVEAGLVTRRGQLAETALQQRVAMQKVDSALPDADARLEGLMVTMNQLAGRRAGLDAELSVVRARVRQAQMVRDAAVLERERTVDDQARLEHEIADELEDLGDDRTIQMVLALEGGGGVPALKPEGDPAELQREVRRLKRELSRLGPVDDAAVSEYQELIDRYQFLSQQSADLEGASVSLTSAMTDLESLIQGGLDKTLEDVNRAFQRTFERLFQGGEARLVWSMPDNPVSSGIDIVAQPPGKRLQPLGNFSGGERALASVALVFALLQVNPTPFCVLDEVDAALDESNVGRFADIIREWSLRTQFIVVTHNRNTMEIADSLFGISMDSHGVSRVVSLKLDEVLAAAEG